MIFQVHPMKKEISLPVLQLKKSANWGRIAKDGNSKNYFAMWMKRLTLSSTKNLRKAQVIPMLRFFADDGDEESGESSDEETASNAYSDDAPPNPLQWSNTLGGINVKEFSVRHGQSRDLGDNATAKDFFNLFINDEFLDEIVRHSIAYARFQGWRNVRNQSSRNFSVSRPQYFARKWWKYLFWFFLNLSMVNGFILEKLAGKRKRRRELAKLLIAGYNGYKRPSNSGKRAVSTFTTEENLRGHFLRKLEGRKRACAMCAKAGRKRKEGQGRTFETSYACEQCGVPLCCQMRGERSCFDEWHS